MLLFTPKVFINYDFQRFNPKQNSSAFVPKFLLHSTSPPLSLNTRTHMKDAT